MKLNQNQWKKFKVTELFDVIKCKGYSTKHLKDGDIPYVARSNLHNGITRYCSNSDKLIKGNCITIHHEWKDFYCSFYQDRDFITDGMIYRLENKHLNRDNGLFICTILNKTRANLKSDKHCGLKSITIDLPSDKFGEPDWEFMEKYISERERDSNQNLMSKFRKIPPKINTKTWRKFIVKDYFDVDAAISTPLSHLQKFPDKKYPYVTTQATNQGIAGYYGMYTDNGNVLVVDSAVAGYMTYQPDNFSASDHVEKLIPKFKLNLEIALFICSVWNSTYASKLFNYGFKASKKVIKNLEILLPCNGKNPDWDYMKKYIESLQI